MYKASRKPLISLGIGIIGLLSTVGCSHPCGFVDMYAQVTPTEGASRTEVLLSSHPLRIVQKISATNSVLDVVVENEESVSGTAHRKVYGRPIYVPYRWYAPVIKPLASATVILPFYLAFRDPHAHTAHNWGASDYLRDVIAWFNPFSAVPAGARRMVPVEEVVTTEKIIAPRAGGRVPVSGRMVVLYMDGNKIAEQPSDAEGRVRFDIFQHLNQESGKTDHLMSLVSPDGKGGHPELNFEVASDVVSEILRLREALDPASSLGGEKP